MEASERLLVAGLLVMALGCATMPETGTAASGEPLAVEVDTRTYQYVSQEKTGEVQHTDASGRYIGSSAIVENRLHTASYEVWALKQGERLIDEQDFFSIAGDQAAADEIARARTIGLAANYGGLGAATLGGAMMLAGLATPLVLSSSTDDVTAWIGLGSLTTVGGLLTAGGVLGVLYGSGQVEAEHHQPLERAQAAAESYNRALGQDRLAVK